MAMLREQKLNGKQPAKKKCEGERLVMVVVVVVVTE